MKTNLNSAKHNSLKTICFIALCALFGMMSNPVNAQEKQRVVSGIVSSLDGPVMGASVTLEGAALGTMTDEEGAFTFPEKLKENDILVISYLGYKTAKVTIEQNTTFVSPFLEDISVVIIANLRTEPKETLPNN